MFYERFSSLVLVFLLVLQNVVAYPSGPPSPVTARAAKTKGGIVYSPYNADGTCKSEAQFQSDVAALSSFSFLRLYGTDCNQVTHGIAAAKAHGFLLFLGMYNIESYENEISTLTALVKGDDWKLVHTVSVGNELVNSGRMSAQDVVNRVHQARGTLRSVGYNGPVVTADTFVAIMAHPILCEASDYVAANCHPFFDGKVTAEGAGDFLKVQSQNVKNACGGKEVLITETGWPTQGNPNGAAVPSEANQAIAIASMQSAMGGNCIWFTAYDDQWKKDTPATFNSEKHWGIKNLNFA